MSGYMCPVCGYPSLPEPAYNEAGGGSLEICPACGFQFGFDDDSEGQTFESWRARWVADGMQWWSKNSARKPAGWDPRAQLASLE